MSLEKLKKDLQAQTKPEKAAFFPRFFKTGKGEYGEGDRFLGVIIPDQRKVAKKYQDLSLPNLKKLLYSPFHEHRLTALFILVDQFKKADEKGQKKIYDFYYQHRARVNNWDLVDSSAHKIMGPYLLERDRSILYKLAESESLWDRRIAMMTSFHFIKKNDFGDALAIAQILVNDSHDLIQKAVGWMLREIGNRDQKVEEQFLDKYAATMPRTMLRYALEKFEKGRRDYYMKLG